MAGFQVDTGGTLTTGLVSWYNLEDTADAFGTNTLTNTNSVAFATGKIGNAADTGSSNTDKRLTNATFHSFTDGSAWSISAWINVTTAPSSGAEHVYVSTTAHTSGSTNDLAYVLKYVNASGTLKVNFARLREGVAWQDGLYTTTLTPGTWYHLVLTYDGSNTRGYLNGTLVSGPTAYSGVGNVSYALGGTELFQRGTTGYASGLLDLAGFWSKALSTTEISDLYNSGNGNAYSASTAYTSNLTLLGVG